MASHVFNDPVANHPLALAASAAVVMLTATYLQSPSWKVRFMFLRLSYTW
jgi:hypothetical protein